MARKPSTIPNMADPNAPAAAGRPTKTKPKRIRRKCSAPGCTNRVVQGGVCVTHGAKRKLCSEPGCNKAVKLAGFCSTHGPARRKCDTAGCTRVAVQGGKCLSHGARRRVCCYPLSAKVGGEKCTKNAIMGGMCKKHYDRVQDAEGMLEMSLCVPTADSPPAAAAAGATVETAISVSGGSASPLDDSDEDGGLEVMSLSTPSWGSAITTATSTASMVSAVSDAPAAAAMPPTLVNSVPSLAGGGHQRRAKKMKPSHQRGLSIFDDMPTVDAIIGNTSGAEQTQPPPPSSQPQPPGYPQARAPPTAPPAAPPAAVAAPPVLSVKYPQGSMSTKTPTPQVSFADCVVPSNRRAGSVPSAPSSAPRGDGESPCTGCASCTCNACRSPTLAIFEQMIQASQIVEKGEQDLAKYAGLSPPKLSPRKASALLSARYAAGVGGDLPTPGRTTPKNVSFLPEEPTSSGSVVRKVSSQNIVGEGGWEENVSAAAANDGGIPQDHQGIAQGYPHHGYHQRGQEAQGAEEGPASHALAAMAARDDASVSRTVSHDLDDGRYQTYSSYFPNHQGSQPPPPPAPHQYSHHPVGTYQEPRGPPPPPQYPQGQGGYAVEYHQAPPPPREGPPQAPYYHHHHATAPQAFHPPQTPALYDNSTPPPQQRDVSRASIVSSGSTHHHHHHCDQHLLPKRRESIAHLFIPKEV